MVLSPASSLTPNADASAAVLTEKLRSGEPFLFVRYGDGALECIRGQKGETCDGEPYSPALGAALLAAWQSMMRHPSVYAGDWLAASFVKSTENTRYAEEWRELVGDASPAWLHPEALLLMRESAELLDFYRAVKADPRRKLFLGPAACAGAAKLLGAAHLAAPMHHLFEQIGRVTRELRDWPFDVLLYGAGMAGNIAVAQCAERYPERVYISLGSAMDPLFRGKTRWQQLTHHRAVQMFAELL